MHFVVIGGAGFIGSHLTDQLLAEGYAVTVVDNFTTGRHSNLPHHPQLRLLQQDISTCKPEDFMQPIHGIAHLAATPSVTQSWLHPLAAHHNNLSTTVAVLQLCRALQASRLVFSSSAAVYGNRVQLPISEDQGTNPISPYGLQKLASEQYIGLFAKQFDLSCIALRLFNVFGPRQLPDSPYSGVISLFAQAMQQRQSITIYGNGQQTRDFVYVQDVACAFIKALTLPLPTGTMFSCNVGTGRATSLMELVHMLKDYCPNWNSDVQYANARLGDIQHSQADIAKITNLLQFTPEWLVSSGLQRLVDSLTSTVS